LRELHKFFHAAVSGLYVKLVDARATIMKQVGVLPAKN